VLVSLQKAAQEIGSILADVSGKGMPAALLFYTDGISEALNREDQEFGNMRLTEFVAARLQRLPAYARH
jgi:serine phosphatase RsbU (regulator of sigma subunit)